MKILAGKGIYRVLTNLYNPIQKTWPSCMQDRFVCVGAQTLKDLHPKWIAPWTCHERVLCFLVINVGRLHQANLILWEVVVEIDHWLVVQVGIYAAHVVEDEIPRGVGTFDVFVVVIVGRKEPGVVFCDEVPCRLVRPEYVPVLWFWEVN